MSTSAGNVERTTAGPARRAALVAAVAALLVPAAAAGSTTVATNAAAPSLTVGADGAAEVDWTAAGARHMLLVPAHGLLQPGGRLGGADVSHAAPAGGIPFAKAVRSGPGGWTYALEAWQVQPGGPVELHFARWRGSPTVARLSAQPTGIGVLLTGSVTFAGRPVPTTSPTPEGKELRQYAYLDAFAGGRWQRLGGVAVKADGTFRRLVPKSSPAKRFRVVVSGPNIGATFAPDALATVALSP